MDILMIINKFKLVNTDKILKRNSLNLIFCL
uniref:Uncharacterized protein n=1 Tax=Strongyloides stercoralis TaxID=6248 RepID=A0A0K0ES41_STRER